MKRPRIELSLHGEHAEELLAWIKERFEVSVLADQPDDEFVPIESTEYWQQMERNRIGNLLAGSRLKAGLTQAQLADRMGIRQNMVSDYERGRRTYSDAMAARFSKVLQVKAAYLRHGSTPAAVANALPASAPPPAAAIVARTSRIQSARSGRACLSLTRESR